MPDKKMNVDQEPEYNPSRRLFIQSGIVAAGSTLLGTAMSIKNADAADQAQEDLQTVQLLFVQTAKGVVFEKQKMTLTGVNPTTIFFSDRPKRIAGHMATDEFILDWQEGTGEDSFSTDPPNATLSIFGEGEIVDIVMELKDPQLNGDQLGYTIGVLEQDHPFASGPCSLFIDPIGMPLSPTSVAGVHRRHRRRRRRRHAVIR